MYKISIYFCQFHQMLSLAYVARWASNMLRISVSCKQIKTVFCLFYDT